LSWAPARPPSAAASQTSPRSAFLGTPRPLRKHLAEILLRPAVAARALDRQALRRGGVPALGLGRILGDARAALVELRQRQLGVETAGLRRDPIVWHGRRRIGLGTPAALQELPDLEAGRDVTARRRLAIERQSRDRILLDPPTLLVQPG
jgi:hypothetical protein